MPPLSHQIAACVAALAVTGTAHAQPLFRTGVELVHFGVTVEDDEGQLITGLTREDFIITEEGEEQGIAYFAQGVETDLGAMPLHVGVLFDTSESMGRDSRFAKTAAIRFLRGLDFAEDMTLVDFDTEVRVSRFNVADPPRLVERLRAQEAGGLTALYDAIGVYLDGAFDQQGRKVLLLYTDGGDTRSRLHIDELLDIIRASDVTIYAVGFRTSNRVAERMMQRRWLESITETTGGRAYFPDDVDDLKEIYDEITAELTGRYSLGYVSSDPTTDGSWRRVEVSLTDPDLEDARIRAREGYFALWIEADPAR